MFNNNFFSLTEFWKFYTLCIHKQKIALYDSLRYPIQEHEIRDGRFFIIEINQEIIGFNG